MSPLCIASVVLLMGFLCLGWPPNCWTCVYFAFHRVNMVKRKQFAKKRQEDLQKQGSSVQLEHAFHIGYILGWINRNTVHCGKLLIPHTHRHTFSWSNIWSIMYTLSILLSRLVPPLQITPGVGHLHRLPLLINQTLGGHYSSAIC